MEEMVRSTLFLLRVLKLEMVGVELQRRQERELLLQTEEGLQQPVPRHLRQVRSQTEMRG
jgi:hypothetical protein